jgi:hypothetical protein
MNNSTAYILGIKDNNIIDCHTNICVFNKLPSTHAIAMSLSNVGVVVDENSLQEIVDDPGTSAYFDRVMVWLEPVPFRHIIHQREE